MPIRCPQCGANNHSGNFLCLSCGAHLEEVREASKSVSPSTESPSSSPSELPLAVLAESSSEPIHDPSAEASSLASNELAEDIRLFFQSPPPGEPPRPRVGRYIVLVLLAFTAVAAGWRWGSIRSFAGKVVAPTAAQPNAGKPSSAPQPSVAATQTATPQPADSTPLESSTTQQAPQEPTPAASQESPRRAHAQIRPASRITRVADTQELEGEKYLSGDGVPVDCDRAQKDLMAAAKHSSVKAETALASMYAAGHCAIRDLPLAYRWFSRAQKQNRRPNPKIAKDMKSLWNQMSPEERQLATR